MRSEEKLNELFKTLREENVTTSVSDVSSWINVHSTSANIKTVKKTAITKKIIIMSAIITTAFIGFIILFSGKQNTKPDNIKSAIIKENRNILHVDSSNKASVKSKKNKTIIPYIQTNSITQINNLAADAFKNEVIKNANDAQLNSNININETDPQTKIEKASRYWRSINDTLTLDTIFNGVKSLVFKGGNDISVRGSKRSNITMNYHYRLKTKGVYLKKANCELSYELIDSVLTIHLEINHEIFIGVGVLSKTSKLEFNIPENIAVYINTSYGDVEVNNLSNSNYHIQTTSGNIQAERVNGNVTLRSNSGDISLKNSELNNLSNNNYHIQTTSGNIQAERVNGNITLRSYSGDVSLKNVLGKIDVSVSSGDIMGNNINVVDALKIACSSGDVYCMITNPTSELMFNLFTASGELNIHRQNLNFRGEGHYTFGKGNVKITAKSSSGNIVVR